MKFSLFEVKHFKTGNKVSVFTNVNVVCTDDTMTVDNGVRVIAEISDVKLQEVSRKQMAYSGYATKGVGNIRVGEKMLLVLETKSDENAYAETLFSGTDSEIKNRLTFLYNHHKGDKIMEVIFHDKGTTIDPDFIINTVCHAYEITYEQTLEMTSKGVVCRKRPKPQARHAMRYFLYIHGKLQLMKIASLTGSTDHSTILHSIQTYKDSIGLMGDDLIKERHEVISDILLKGVEK